MSSWFIIIACLYGPHSKIARTIEYLLFIAAQVAYIRSLKDATPSMILSERDVIAFGLDFW